MEILSGRKNGQRSLICMTMASIPLFGESEKNPAHCLGVRWNGGPPAITVILVSLDRVITRLGLWKHSFFDKDDITGIVLGRVTKTPASGNIQNIQTALDECT
jgi:hypothetical protein